MSNNLDRLYDELQKIQAKIEVYFDSLQEKWQYKIEGGKVKFDRLVKEAHRRYKIGIFRYILTAKLVHILSAPIIYGMVVPLTFLDLCLNIYQQTCFRLYGIPLLRRRDYLVVDRHLLGYLNGLEKLNCLYCSYGNGLIAFAREILARTEQYWCPIKHAAKIKDPHDRYRLFSDFGDAEHYREQARELREGFKTERIVNK